MRCTEETGNPDTRANSYVTPSYKPSNVFTMTASIPTSSIERGAPERLSIRRSANRRRRHLPTEPAARAFRNNAGAERQRQRCHPRRKPLRLRLLRLASLESTPHRPSRSITSHAEDDTDPRAGTVHALQGLQ